MKETNTRRGFPLVEFKDRHDQDCSLQTSSIAFENCIWLGCDNPKVRAMKKDYLGHGTGWCDVEIPEYAHIMPSRMHLSQENVKDLLPYLIRFAKTGEIFGDEEPLPFTAENGDC